MPSSLDDWRRYVWAVSKRYVGKIDAYEVLNEPNLPMFFSGSPADAVRLTDHARRLVRRIDRRALVVGPGVVDRHGTAVPWLDQFLAGGGGKFIDTLSLHLYPQLYQNPEQKLLLFRAHALLAKYRLSKPVWDTESQFQWPNRRLSEGMQAAFVARTYLFSAGHRVTRVYWYSYDGQFPLTVRLTQTDRRTPSLAGQAYATMYKYMVGWTATGCARDAEDTWTCSFYRNGKQELAVWNPSRVVRVRTPSWARSQMLLDGRVRRVHPRAWVQVTAVPLLLRAA